MAAKTLMQALSSGGGGDGTLKSWVSDGYDFAGSGFPGPGTPADVAALGARPSVTTSGGGGGGGDGFGFTFSTTTADADPGAGTVRLNSGTIASVTEIFIDLVDTHGSTITSYLDSLTSGRVRVGSISDPTKWAEFVLSGVTTATGYRKLNVSGGLGSLPTTVSGDTFVSFDTGGAAQTADESTLHLASNVYSVKTNGVGNSQLRQGTACTVIGRSANSTGNVADIALANDDEVLMRTSGAVTSGKVANANVSATAGIVKTKLENSNACSVVGRSANSSGALADISAGADNTGLFRRSGALVFSSINLTTDVGSLGAAGTVYRVNAAGAALESVARDIAAVACATTGNITLSGEQTIDGVATSASRVLAWKQTTGSQNGIYVSAAGAWARATDQDDALDFRPGALFAVAGGTANGGLLAALLTTGAVTVGTTALTYGLSLAAPVSGTDDNKVAYGSSGRLLYAQVTNTLVDPAAAIAGSKINPDFAAQNITTTGAIFGNSGTSFIRLGVTSAGTTRSATQGFLRVHKDFTWFIREKTDNTDFQVFAYDQTNDILQFGSNSANSKLAGTNATIDATTLITLSIAAGGIFFCESTRVSIGANNLRFQPGVASGNIYIEDENTASTTGKLLTMHGQNKTGATATGGSVALLPGTGTALGGELYLASSAGTKRIRISDPGLAFFNAAPVAQPADLGAFTDSTGSGASGLTINDVTATPTQTLINDNFHKIVGWLANLRANVNRPLGLTA